MKFGSLVSGRPVGGGGGGGAEMLRLRAFRPTPDKIVKIQVHPTQPWIVTADASDHVSVWNWEHRQVGLIPLCVVRGRICGTVVWCMLFD